MYELILTLCQPIMLCKPGSTLILPFTPAILSAVSSFQDSRLHEVQDSSCGLASMSYSESLPFEPATITNSILGDFHGGRSDHAIYPISDATCTLGDTKLDHVSVIFFCCNL